MTTSTGRRIVAGFLLAGLLASGCGRTGARPQVHGQVTFQGKPVAGQTLTLYSEGTPGQFFTQKLPLDGDGRFAGEVPAPGDYKVVIEEALAVQEGRKPAGASGPVIPRKYRTAAASDLVWTIHDGDNQRQIELPE